ncbi:hypothetical protein AGOR_G00217580 [Albula goreensis]|uniref:T-cell surface glycoprotein CD3 zeta chain n=1 Tax=Albula goreensis TaxID=1534307 RepID=A0A8T3CR58_9TELE|nr:hypothetical protein AGOR_G00217580 [Albula goreensis]
MDLWSAGVLAFLASSVPSAEASGWGINNPKVCYILDVILLLYGLIMTALLIREKFRKRKASTSDGLYTDLQPHRGSYDPPRPRNDPETGRGNRRQAGDDLYTPLQKPNMETYNQIHVKQERRRNKSEQVYQGLSSATKDTYDSLHMQPMPPRR